MFHLQLVSVQLQIGEIINDSFDISLNESIAEGDNIIYKYILNNGLFDEEIEVSKDLWANTNNMLKMKAIITIVFGMIVLNGLTPMKNIFHHKVA